MFGLWRAWREAGKAVERDFALEHLQERLDEMKQERDYWRDKAEILLDATLFHRGEVRHHVFSKPEQKPAEDTSSPFMRVFGALSRTEIETPKPAPTAHE